MLNDFGKELLKPWCSVQNFVLGLSILFIVVLLVRHFSLDSDELASWVQAIGAIASIWGAVWISTRQQQEHRRNAVADSLSMLDATLVLVQTAVETALDAIKKEKDYRDVPDMFDRIWKGIYSDSLLMSIDALKEIRVYELGSNDLVSAFVMVKACLVRIHRAPTATDPYQVVPSETFMAVEFNNQANLLNAFWDKFKAAHALRTQELRNQSRY